VLGVHAVSGRGEAFKSGGRVVKNVTGYDLSKALAGSWGTLAVVTDVTFKVLPRPETAATLVLAGLDDERAVATLCHAMGAPWEVSGAAHLPEAVVAEVPDAAFAAGSRAATLIRLEGFAPSVAYRAEKLAAELAPLGDIAVLEASATEAAWRALRDAEIFATTSHPVWRASVSPALRTSIAPFEPQPEALTALSRRLKEQFDPRGILNPGRLASGAHLPTFRVATSNP
jgi:glycolate oxidase FAD binding subunit